MRSAIDIAPGTVLGGKYRIERLLGQGGMGVVLLAHHEELDHRVAIKVLAGDMAENPESVARFMREARAAAKLQSEHVTRVTDVGRFEGVGPYMVMEYLKGADLAQVSQRRGSLPIAEAVDCILEALDALAEAHAIGIVHRDLKPSNLFLADRTDGTQTIKVLDFGISKVDALQEPSSPLTSTSTVIGSPAYMSPEQLKSSRDVDARADVWSIGVVLYELLAGRLPFEGETVGALFTSIVADAPKPLRPIRADIPELLEGTILRCLAKDAKARYSSAGDLAQALAPFGSGRASKEVQRAIALTRHRAAVHVETRIAPLAAPGPEQQTQNSWQTPRDPQTVRTRRPMIIAVIAGGGLAVVIGIVALVVVGQKESAPRTAAPLVTTSATVSAASSTTAIPTLVPAPPASSVAIASASASASPRPVKSVAPTTTSTSFLDRQR